MSPNLIVFSVYIGIAYSKTLISSGISINISYIYYIIKRTINGKASIVQIIMLIYVGILVTFI